MTTGQSAAESPGKGGSPSARAANRESQVRPVLLALVKKLGHLLFVLLGVTFLVSAVLEFLPGDPARAILGENATAEQVAILREQLGLDDNLIVRYWHWLTSALQGDLGISYRTSQPVGEAILQRLPVSFELMVLVQIAALVLAVGLALYATYRPNGFVDKITSFGAFFAISTPHFVVGLAAVFLFAVTLGWLPASGFRPVSAGIGLNLVFLVLPVIAMAMEPTGVYLRLLREDLRVTMGEEFVLAAQAKGMSTLNILLRQVLRPSSFSLVTLAGLNMARLIGSAVVIETLFAIPGMGRLLVDSVTGRDLVMIQALVAVIAVIYVVANLLIDLAYLILDPRLRNDST